MTSFARRLLRRIFVSALAAAACAVAAVPADAHDIPMDVKVQAFVRPAGHTLQLLVRVPLSAMRDMDYPKRGPNGLVDVAKADPTLIDAATLWIGDYITMYENGEPLPYPQVAAVMASEPGDPSFTEFDTALAHVKGPRLPETTELYWSQGMLDVLFEYPIQSDRSRFSIHPAVGRLGMHVVTVLRFLPPGTPERAFEFPGDPGIVRLDPSWLQAALTFVRMGFWHILDGTDHLLFLFCLVIPFRRIRGLIPVVTAFTVAHSITLLASAYDLAPGALWFPPLIETLIAASIVYMALENIAAVGIGRRWLITFGFGLVHGFGFSFALRETLQFAGRHLLTSLLSFNIGVELGQLFVLALMVPALELFFRYMVAERMGTIILSALVAHTGWHWMMDRYGVLSQFEFSWPVIDAAFVATALRWAMLAVAIAGLAWVVSLLKQPSESPAQEQEVEAET